LVHNAIQLSRKKSGGHQCNLNPIIRLPQKYPKAHI
jgi:hypothetical protein